MSFRFSPRPNRANEIQWRAWSADAFAEAVAADKPVLLNLTAVWCHWCHLMDETTYSSPDFIQLINDNMIPVRVDADQHPHVQDRYIAGGWPTNAFLTPTGEVLWSGTYVPPEQFAQVAAGVLDAWGERRDELKIEIERRRKAMAAARSRHHIAGLVRREAADDVLSATVDAFDARNGGFGTEPKFPYVDAIELLLVEGPQNPDYLRMAEHTLDGMLSGDLWDNVGGGFFRYATAADWTQPRYEKLLSVNAAMLRIYAMAGHARNREEWRNIARDIVAWADRTLRQPNGLWAGSQAADNDYYETAVDQRGAAPAIDEVLYTSYNAQWIRALADAGARLGKRDWVDTAHGALNVLLEEMSAPGDLMFHFRRPGEEPRIAFLLIDTAETARACIALAQATGDPAMLAHAHRLVSAMERAFWAEDGGLWDRTKGADDVGALRYREKPFDINADCARMLNDFMLATGERGMRGLAERILAMLSPQAGRYGVAGANYALTVNEFFEAPLRVFVVGPGEEVAALRDAALQVKVVNRQVWTLPNGGRIGQHTFPPQHPAAAYIVAPRGTSPAITQPEKLQEAVVSLS